jgi:3-isopropylmalate/(R)-2-methylmalate dehydratase small subunit
VQVSAEVGEQLLAAIEADPSLELTIDIERGTLSAPAIGLETTFPLDDATRERYLEGLDDVGITLRNEGAITTFEAARPDWMPTA